jgi:hypothetical protein
VIGEPDLTVEDPDQEDNGGEAGEDRNPAGEPALVALGAALDVHSHGPKVDAA